MHEIKYSRAKIKPEIYILINQKFILFATQITGFIGFVLIKFCLSNSIQ